MVQWDDGLGTTGSGYYPLALHNPTSASKTYHTSKKSAHTHSVDLPNYNVPDRSTDLDSGHTHQVAVHEVSFVRPSGTAEHLPSYVGLLKLMRVK